LPEWNYKDTFGNIIIELNVFDVSQQPLENDDICEVDMIESQVENT